MIVYPRRKFLERSIIIGGAAEILERPDLSFFDRRQSMSCLPLHETLSNPVFKRNVKPLQINFSYKQLKNLSLQALFQILSKWPSSTASWPSGWPWRSPAYDIATTFPLKSFQNQTWRFWPQTGPTWVLGRTHSAHNSRLPSYPALYIPTPSHARVPCKGAVTLAHVDSLREDLLPRVVRCRWCLSNKHTLSDLFHFLALWKAL